MASKKKKAPRKAKRKKSANGERLAALSRKIHPSRAPTPPSPERIAAVQRGDDLLAALRSIVEAVDDTSRSDDDVRELMQHIDDLWARHIRAKNLGAPALDLLQVAVETGASFHQGRGYPLKQAAQQTVALLRSRYPEVAQRAEPASVEKAVAAWGKRRDQWDEFHALAKSLGLNPPSNRTMKQSSSRRRSLRLKKQR